jgi:tetratricopeptide (TPR) repeat protein
MAAPPSPPALHASAAQRSVEADLRRADAARRAGRWKEAEPAYRAAWNAAPRPEIAGELGLCELALGRYRDAAEHLERSLEYPEALAPAQRARFERGQERAEREVVTVAVSVSHPDAEVFVDDRSIGNGKGSYVVFVEPGRHAAKARLAGDADRVYRFETAPRRRRTSTGTATPI